MISVKMKHLLFVCMGLLLALSYAGCSNSGSEERTENVPTSKIAGTVLIIFSTKKS